MLCFCCSCKQASKLSACSCVSWHSVLLCFFCSCKQACKQIACSCISLHTVLLFSSFVLEALIALALLDIGRKAITNQISTFYNDAVANLVADGKWGSYRPAFTCDLWHAPQAKEYMSVTAHWVEPTQQEFTLKMRVLGSFAVNFDHIDGKG